MVIAVLGLGPSLAEFSGRSYDLTIGVNDIWRVVKTDVVVCLDNHAIFTPERLKWILECKPKAFFSQMVIWDTRPDFKKIDFIPGYPETVCNLDLNKYPKSYCSPFVACEIAYKYYDANEIHLFGVDMVNHPHLDKNICARIVVHFRNLKTALTAKGCQLIVHGQGILKDI